MERKQNLKKKKNDGRGDFRPIMITKKKGKSPLFSNKAVRILETAKSPLLCKLKSKLLRIYFSQISNSNKDFNMNMDFLILQMNDVENSKDRPNNQNKT